MTKVLTISKRLCYTLPPNRRLQEYAVMGEKDDTLLNSRQVAELLDLSPDTINELARKHSLPGMKRGRQWRFRRRDVDFFKSQRREQAAA
jgi:excisionase family DNA binding protein